MARLPGHRRDETTIKETARDVEYIFHLAAAYREARYGDDYYHKVHVTSTQHGLHRRRVAFYTKDRVFDTRKIRETLGWQPRYSNQNGLEQTARGVSGPGLGSALNGRRLAVHLASSH